MCEKGYLKKCILNSSGFQWAFLINTWAVIPKVVLVCTSGQGEESLMVLEATPGGSVVTFTGCFPPVLVYLQYIWFQRTLVRIQSALDDAHRY